MLKCFTQKSDGCIPITLIASKDYKQWLEKQSETTIAWLASTQFQYEKGDTRLIPDKQGHMVGVICCVNNLEDFWSVGNLPLVLPEGNYKFLTDNEKEYAIAWGLGAYQFTRYKKPNREAACLYVSDKTAEYVNNIVESIYLTRDLINTPTDDMGPSQLAEVAKELAAEYKASFTQIVGEDLFKENYACIYTVGRASDDAPRLLDIRWGKKDHPKITLVGKGVCFDSGGLDLKPAPYMLLMKKDMAGGANVLGLARMIMQANLPVCLRVLIPAVENVVSGNAYRPGDIIKSRKGLTIEIGNTDAEGRVVLADALTEAASENPEMIIDVSTLTGAARVAVGTDISAMFVNNEELSKALLIHADKTNDPIWRLPLYTAYRESLNSTIADINNNSTDSYAGAITAALFLKDFVPDNVPWVHFDIMAWNLRSKPGRPAGGEAMAIRALFSYLSERYTY